MIQSIATMVETGKPPYAYSEMLHVVRVLEAMEQSLVEQRAIDVANGAFVVPPSGGI